MTTAQPADLTALLNRIREDLKKAVAGPVTPAEVLSIRRGLTNLDGERRRVYAGQLPASARRLEHDLLKAMKDEFLPALRRSILDAAPTLDDGGTASTQAGDLIERASLHTALEKWLGDRGDIMEGDVNADQISTQLQQRIAGYRSALDEAIAGSDTPDIQSIARCLFAIEILVWCLEELNRPEAASVAKHERRQVAGRALQSVTRLFESFNAEKSLLDRFEIAVVTSDVDNLIAILTRLFDVEHEEINEGADKATVPSSVQAIEDFLAATERLNDNFVRTIEAASANPKVDTDLFAGAVQQIEKIQMLSRKLAHRRAEKTAAQLQERCRNGLARVCNRLHELAKTEMKSEKPDGAVLKSIRQRVAIVEALIQTLG